VIHDHALSIKAKTKRFVVMESHRLEYKSAMMEIQKILTDVIQCVVSKKTLSVQFNYNRGSRFVDLMEQFK
jgi:hypothetical protein